MADITYPRFCTAGDTAVIVELGAGIDRDINAAVMRLNGRVKQAAIPGVIETVPTFRSVLIYYDPLTTSGERVEHELVTLLKDDEAASEQAKQLWRFPICYDGEDFAPDLTDVSERTGLSEDQVIKKHLAGRYSVYMLGTFPGLGFMGDVDPALSLPRRKNPRTKLPAGSVGITGKLTTIYPVSSPGGWNLIGRSPVKLFDASRDQPALMAPGDEITFERVDLAEFSRLADSAKDGSWQLEPVEIIQ